jgi:hypothetical protein
VVAGISEGVVLGGLLPDTQYQLTVSAIYGGNKKFRSRVITFRTLGETDGSGEWIINYILSSICFITPMCLRMIL